MFHDRIFPRGEKMGIYTRDYTVLDSDELEEIREIELRRLQKSIFRPVITSSKGVRHFNSLFPNNFLDYVDLQKVDELNEKLQEFNNFLNNPEITEIDVLRYIRENEAFFIIASVLKRYSFGHHDAFIFPEFKLGTTWVVDYLIVGRNSDGYHFVFVELEDPYKRIVLKNGHIGDAFKKGLQQINDWKQWISMHPNSMDETFNKYKNKNEQLPREFTNIESNRCHFVVVAGRREHFTENIRFHKREIEINRVLMLHYDNLINSTRSIIGSATY